MSVLFFLALFSEIHAQDVTTLLQDTVEVKTIPLDRIPTSAGETTIKASRIAETLIKDERIDQLRKENDSILFIIDSLLTVENTVDYKDLNLRYLRNRINFWVDYQTLINGRKKVLSTAIKTLSDKQKTLEDHQELWKNTIKKLESQEIASTLTNLVGDVTFQIDSVSKLINAKTNQLLQILEKMTRYGVDVEDVINQLNDQIEQRQSNIFSATNPAVWRLDYTERKDWQVLEYLDLFYTMDIHVLVRYYLNNEGTFILYFIYIALLILLFFYFRKKINKLSEDDFSPYKRSLKKILSNPLSAALVLGLFSSMLFFQNRPLIFMDIIVLLTTVPLVIIIRSIVSRMYRKYLLIFVVLIVLRFIDYIFPPEIVLHRIITFIIGIVVVVVLVGFTKLLETKRIQHQFFQNLLKFLIVLHIAFASIGIISNIFGNVNLADLGVNLAVINTFIGLLLFVTARTLIGLIELGIEGKYLRKLNFIRKNSFYLKRRIASLVFIVATIFWLISILRVIGIYTYVSDFFKELFTDEYKVGSASFTLGSVVLFFFVIWLSVIISKIIKVVLEEDVLQRLSLKKGVPRMISVMTRYTLVTFGVLLAVSAAGMPLDSLTIIFGAFSVGIGFGLQNIFNNLVSGLILLFERPVQIGDTVEVGSLIGIVKSMGIRSSNVRTFDGAEVIVPNGHLISNEVVNWTLSDKRRRIEIISGVAYGSDVHKVQKLMYEVLRKHPDVIDDPEPLVLFNDMGESSLDFRLLFWTDHFEEWLRIRSEVVFMVHDALYEEGIEIPFPQRDLHIKSIPDKNFFGDKKESE